LKRPISINLFGRFSIRGEEEPLLEDAPVRTQELLAYLVLHSGKLHPRQALAKVLWPQSSPGQSRRYLRQALWVLRKRLREEGGVDDLIQQDPAHVQLKVPPTVTVDVLEFAEAFRGLDPPSSLDECSARRAGIAVSLYRGDLLEGWYSPWCEAERDRLQRKYVLMLDRLAQFHESRRDYETAIGYATASLRMDRSSERVHLTLMRLLYHSGDRTGALRQFERCRSALREELDVEPGAATMALYRDIRADRC
jgi:DNA-binding SARP family transcriptional activator